MTEKRFEEWNGVIERVSEKYGSDSEIYLPFNTLITIQTDNLELYFDIKKIIKSYFENELKEVMCND